MSPFLCVLLHTYMLILIFLSFLNVFCCCCNYPYKFNLVPALNIFMLRGAHFISAFLQQYYAKHAELNIINI